MSYTQRLTKRSVRRSLALTASGAMIFALTPLQVATAAVEDICPPPGESETDAFADDETSVHEDNINCAAAYDIINGTTASTFEPNGTLTRGQAASILVQWAETAQGAELTADGTDDFSDDDDSVHEENIEKAADNGLVQGFDDGTFRPNETITRAQFATIAVQATELVLGSDLTDDGTDDFSDDDDSVHEANIEKAVDNDILSGTGAGEFSPREDVTRGQTASIAMQAAGNVLFPEGEWAPTEAVVSDGVTSLPELRKAEVKSVHATNGTTVAYTFDEPVTGAAPSAALFHVYNNSLSTSANGNTATVDSTDNRVVNVVYTGITTQSAADGLTVATVDAAAVSDAGTNANPYGDAALNGSGQTSTLPAGVTSAPDLQSVTNFRDDPAPAAGAGDTLVDFVFDETAWVNNTAGFHLVLDTNTLVNCTATAATATTAGSTTLTASCPSSTTNIPASSVARGFVDAAAVSDGNPNFAIPQNTNPLQATQTPDGNSSGPDLVSAQFFPNSTNADQVLYTFDGPVLAPGAVAPSFSIYYTDGTSKAAPAGTPTRNPSNNSQVLVTFTDGDVDGAVGANVAAGSVASATGSNPTNQADEVGVENTSTSATAGATTAPDLMGVSVQQIKDTFGNVTGTRTIFKFDEAVQAVTQANFYLYNATGGAIAFDAASCVAGTATNSGTDTVRCESTDSGSAYTNAKLGAVDNAAVTDGTNANVEGAEAVTQS